MSIGNRDHFEHRVLRLNDLLGNLLNKRESLHNSVLNIVARIRDEAFALIEKVKENFNSNTGELFCPRSKVCSHNYRTSRHHFDKSVFLTLSLTLQTRSK
jgi:hypothetical protein